MSFTCSSLSKQEKRLIFTIYYLIKQTYKFFIFVK